jgi:ribosomal protein S18 acetylase RimI-like enzyme
VRAFDKDSTCYIGKLIVKSEYQNRGFGKLLMCTIESFFQSVDRFELFTGFKSEKNLHIYKGLGYKEIKRERISPEVILVFMEKENSKSSR